jgi:hypothetical protein
MKMVRQFIALFLVTCLGILIPTAASTVRVCRLESTIYLGGFESFGATAGTDGFQKAKCCPDCGDESEDDDPCCLELRKLPDAPEPSAPVGLPPVLPVESSDYAVNIERIEDHCREIFSAAEPIRGPTSRGVRRAMLGVWNI